MKRWQAGLAETAAYEIAGWAGSDSSVANRMATLEMARRHRLNVWEEVDLEHRQTKVSQFSKKHKRSFKKSQSRP